jgi:hypothetical protein
MIGNKDSAHILYYPSNIRRTWNLTAILQIPAEQEGFHSFYLYLTGTTRDAIEEFLAYQAEKEALGIQIKVEPVTYADEIPMEDTSVVESFLHEDDEQINPNDNLVDNGKLIIGISRLKIVTPRPYKITYIIDPTVSGTVQRSKSLAVGFNMSRTSGVKCSVGAGGKVNADLQEMNTNGYWETRQTQNNVNGLHTFSNTNATKTGSWQVYISGVAISSDVTVQYERVVT